MTTKRTRTTRPLRSSPVTEPSPLLRGGPPLCAASVLCPSQFQLLGVLPSTGRANTRPASSARQLPEFHTGAQAELRDLFPTRIALRLLEAGHVDLILGDGARNRGALCDQIPDDDPHKGIGYVDLAGHPEPARVRFSYLTDDDIRAMARTYPAAPEILPARPVPVPATTGRSPRQHSYRPTSLKDGPLLPSGLLDALQRNDNDGEDSAA